MPPVFAGRFTAHTEEPFVVFLIGMRVNKFLHFRKWTFTANAMGQMLPELYANPDKGFLGGHTFFQMWPPMTLMLSYWRSFEDLERYAHSKEDAHFPAWRRFNKLVGTDGSVGIWHETYLVQAGGYEVVYGNMPLFGLAKATQHVPATGRRETARRRLGGENEPAVETPD